MLSVFAKLFGCEPKASSQPPLANAIRRYTMEAPESEGAKDRLFEKRLLTFGDDDVVDVYAGDIRAALTAARNNTEPHPDRFRLEYDWDSGRLTSTDGRAHVGVVSDGGLLTVASFILGRIRRDDARPRGRPVFGA